MDEGAVWEGAVADYWVPRESTAPGRPRLDGDRLQHAVSPSDDTGREYPPSWVEKAAAAVDPRRAMDGAKQRVWRKIHLGID